MQIFNMAGGGGSGEALLVSAPAGATVTASNGSRTLSKVADSTGRVIFNRLTFGTWTISITDGDNTDSKEIEIMPYYKAGLSFFKATIHITYPAGIVCTVTDGTTTLLAPDTTGTWDCAVPNAGTWTVALSNGLSESVAVTNGDNVTINKWYLYKNGDKRTNVTGGWEQANAANGIITFNDTNIYLGYKGTNSRYMSIYSANKINVIGVANLCVRISNIVTGSTGHFFFGVRVDAYNGTSGSEGKKNWAAETLVTDFTADITTLKVDISALTGDYVVQICAEGTFKGTIHEIYLEV